MGLRGICCGRFLRNAQAISLRAAQYHLLTVVEKEMFSRCILACGDFGAQRATRARPVGRRVSVLRQSRGGQGLQGAWGGGRVGPRPLPAPEAAQTPGGVKSPCPEGKIKQRMENRMPLGGYALDGYFFYVLAGSKVCRNTSHDGYHPDSMAFLRPLVGATGYLLPGVVVMSRTKG